MSIWIDLLFMHGHFATPRVLEHLLTPAAEPVVPPAAGPGEPGRGPDTGPREPARVRRPYAEAPPRLIVHHPFRAVGQLS